MADGGLSVARHVCQAQFVLKNLWFQSTDSTAGPSCLYLAALKCIQVDILQYFNILTLTSVCQYMYSLFFGYIYEV